MSDANKPLDVAVVLVDVEEAGSDCGVEQFADEEKKEDVARQLARAMGAEELFGVFHQQHPDGTAPVDRLPTLFAAAGLPASEEGIAAAITQLCPEAGTERRISFAHAQEVFLQLQAEAQKAQLLSESLHKTGWLTHWISSLSDTESTNLLLIVVVVVCSISALLAGGVAIALLITDSVSNVDTYAQEDLAMVQDTIDVFAKQLAYQVEENKALSFLTTLATTLQDVVYLDKVDSTRTGLLRSVTAMAATLAQWTDFVPQQTFVELASMAALLTNASVVKYGVNGTAALFDEVNAEIPNSYELLLGRWRNNTPGVIEFLTHFRNCTDAQCVVTVANSALMAAALSGTTSARLTVDYHQRPVIAGSTGIDGIGVEVKVDTNTLVQSRYHQLQALMEAWTAASGGKIEFMLGYEASPGVRLLLTPLQGCAAPCAAAVAAGSPLARALSGEAGTMRFTNVQGVEALAAFSQVGTRTLGIAVQTNFSSIATETVADIVSLVDRLNTQYPSGTQEFELTAFTVQAGNYTFQHLSAYQHADECPFGQCIVATPYVQLAARNCSVGVLTTTDYRGKQVLAGYSCLANLSAVLSLKWDISDVEAGILQTIIAAVNDRTAQDLNYPAQFLVATPNPGLTAAEVTGYGDFQIPSAVKFPAQCASHTQPNCTWNSQDGLRALQGFHDVIDCPDYRAVAVKAASSLSTATSAGVGLALEVERTPALQSMTDLAIRIGCFAIGMVAGSVVLLVWLTKRSLSAMIRAKEEHRAVVETEKDRFSKLVASMYPGYVVPRLLAGEKQLVCEVPGAAVFFSDIHEFTSASNTMGSTELLLLMGYVYGVMDDVAGRFGVYKVKTIGDAYLAVAGLPGSETDNPSLDLLRFASFVCQVFGDRFVHPAEGQVLAAMNKAMPWNSIRPPAPERHRGPSLRVGGLGLRQKSTGVESAGAGAGGAQPLPSFLKRRQQRAKVAVDVSPDRLDRPKDTDGGESVCPSAPPPPLMARRAMKQRPRLASVAQSASTDRTEEPPADKVQCVMSYGLAVGKLVAGVLAGRCPMFDIWGATVNLASRMQSTGEPGRIQVSEQLYKKVTAEPNQPFTFDAPRSTYCKGFGDVQAYMVLGTTEGLPKDLQAQLRLEPRYAPFAFDNPLAAIAPTEGEKTGLGRAKPPPPSLDPPGRPAPMILLDL
eukprot:EG_transcript_725